MQKERKRNKKGYSANEYVKRNAKQYRMGKMSNVEEHYSLYRITIEFKTPVNV